MSRQPRRSSDYSVSLLEELFYEAFCNILIRHIAEELAEEDVDVEVSPLIQLEKLSKEGYEPAKKYLEAFKKFESVMHLVRTSSATNLAKKHTLQSRILLDLASVLVTDSKLPSWTSSEMTTVSTIASLAFEKQISSPPSKLDKAIRICQLYFFCFRNRDADATLALAIESCEKYPTEPYFHFIHCSMLGFLKKIEEGIQVVTKALEIFPTNLDLLYNKASFLKHAGKISIEERIEARQAFLQHAPKIDRHVPVFYYEIGLLTATEGIPLAKSCKVFTRALNTMKKAIKNGEDAEKHIILPYNFEKAEYLRASKSFLQSEIEKAELQLSTFENEDESSRIIILNHRCFIKTVSEKSAKLTNIFMSGSSAVTKSEVAVINPPKHNMKYTSIEPVILTTSGSESNVNLSLILQQSFYGEITECEISNFDITKFDKDLQKSDIQELFGVGCKISIFNAIAKEGRIVIDNPCTASLIFHVKERLDRPCYYCGMEDARKRCRRCKVANYCDSHCQKRDWNVFDHRKICSTRHNK